MKEFDADGQEGNEIDLRQRQEYHPSTRFEKRECVWQDGGKMQN